nr:MAG TPA: helix-turn-helix domain protein [Caudoviricetes sp.]
MKNTQPNLVLLHLERHRSITPIEAFENYGITRLSAVVFTLRKRGYDIDTTIQHATNRYGKKVSYAKYILQGGSSNGH